MPPYFYRFRPFVIIFRPLAILFVRAGNLYRPIGVVGFIGVYPIYVRILYAILKHNVDKSVGADCLPLGYSIVFHKHFTVLIRLRISKNGITLKILFNYSYVTVFCFIPSIKAFFILCSERFV